jgi:hypothetical protein
MHEREFQNMFVFTPGFEAATLKIPQREQQEDDALTLGVNGVNPRKQIVSLPFLFFFLLALCKTGLKGTLGRITGGKRWVTTRPPQSSKKKKR